MLPGENGRNRSAERRRVIYRGDMAYTVSLLDKTQWRLVTVSYPRELLSVYSQQKFILIALVCGTAVIASWGIAMVLSERLSVSIKGLSKEMAAFEKDIYGYRYQPEKVRLKKSADFRNRSA